MANVEIHLLTTVELIYLQVLLGEIFWRENARCSLYRVEHQLQRITRDPQIGSLYCNEVS